MNTRTAENLFGSSLDRVQTFAELRNAVERIRAHWDWIPANAPGNPSRVGAQANSLLSRIDEALGSGQDLEAFVTATKEAASSWRLIHPSTALAGHIDNIRATEGDLAGGYAYALAVGWAGPGDATSMPLYRALLLMSLGTDFDAPLLAERLAKERTNFRQGLERAEASATAEAKRREEEWTKFLSETGQRLKGYHRSRLRRLIGWRSKQRDLLDGQRASIQAVEDAFREQMGLKAPVEYWEGKAQRHAGAERLNRTLLIAYFFVAATLMTALFAGTAWFVTDPAREITTPVYFVLSAGLAALTGMIIWVGRLLTRLFLSEHHLRKDAEERATMTTTYLALTENGAASDADRQIILTALFRNTTDGIVRDDAAPDVGLGALVSRAITPSR